MRNLTVSDVNFIGTFRNDVSPAVLKLTDYSNYMGAGTQQITHVIFRADSGGNLASTYLLIASRGVKYYVWYTINGVGVDPNPGGGAVGVPIPNLAIGSSAATVQAVTDAALNNLGGSSGAVFTFADASSGTSNYTNTICGPGAATSAAGTSGFTVTTPTAGVDYNASSRGIYKLTGPDGMVFYKNIGWDTNSFGPAYPATPPAVTTYDSYNWPLSPVPPYNAIFNFPLPLDASGNVLQGNYTIEYKIEDNAGLPLYLKGSFNYVHQPPICKIEQEVDCFSSIISSRDATNYNSPEGDYSLSLTRSHKLYYPQGLNKDPESVTGDLITITPIYDKTWTTTILTTAYYRFGTGNFYIQDKIEGSQEILVNCDENLCGILCGLEKLNNRYLESVARGRTDKDLLFYKLNRITQLMNLFGNAQKCGQGSNADLYLKEIYIVGEFDPDCGCSSSDDPKLIVPLYNIIGGANVIVQNGVGILVAGVLSNGTMTYTVSLSSVYQDRLNVLFNTEITSTDGSVTITPSVDGLTLTYNLSVAGGSLPGALSITTAMLQDLCVTDAKIAAHTITDDKIAANTITNASIAAHTITQNEMGNNSIGTNQVQNGAISGPKIAAGTIEQSNMDASSIGSNELIALSVTNGKIAANAIDTSKLDATLQYSRMNMPASFETDEVGNIQWPIDIFPAQMTLFRIMVVITKTIVGGGTINFIANPGGTPFIAAPFNIPPGTTIGTTYTFNTPFLLPGVIGNGTFEIDTTAISPGGRAEVIVYYTRG